MRPNTKINKMNLSLLLRGITNAISKHCVSSIKKSTLHVQNIYNTLIYIYIYIYIYMSEKIYNYEKH